MGCCGKKRTQFFARGVDPPSPEPPHNNPPLRRPASPSAVFFEYIGETGLTAFGPITGRHYRFSAPGARVAVDGRDAPSVMAVPSLRPVRSVL
jgi:hypothetical protein